jgi:predicted dehydrogenase
MRPFERSTRDVTATQRRHHGLGFIAERGHLPAYVTSDALEIIAVADINPARRAAAARALPGARIYEDHRALLAAEGDRLDFADITAPPYAHVELARAALERDLHVLCEKPLATDAADAHALCELAADQRRVLFPSHNYKHAPVIKAVRELLAKGTIGEVHMVTLSTFRNTHARGVNEWNPHWRRQRRYSGGGIAMDHGSHTFYLAFEWMRSYPTSVVATMSAVNGFDTEDNFQAVLTFPTGIASAQLTWTAGVRKVLYTLHGERGALRIEDGDIEISVLAPSDESGAPPRWERTGASVASAWMDSGHAGWFGSLFANFTDAMDRDDHLGADTLDALRCIEVIDAAYASSAEESREHALRVAV